MGVKKPFSVTLDSSKQSRPIYTEMLGLATQMYKPISSFWLSWPVHGFLSCLAAQISRWKKPDWNPHTLKSVSHPKKKTPQGALGVFRSARWFPSRKLVANCTLDMRHVQGEVCTAIVVVLCQNRIMWIHTLQSVNKKKKLNERSNQLKFYWWCDFLVCIGNYIFLYAVALYKTYKHIIHLSIYH